jgi:hypothetical protein
MHAQSTARRPDGSVDIVNHLMDLPKLHLAALSVASADDVLASEMGRRRTRVETDGGLAMSAFTHAIDRNVVVPRAWRTGC